jgi:N-sulfoglucosamine sulfohydrolase
VFNFTTTHESQLSPEASSIVKNQQIPARPRIDPKDIKLPPYHPDLPEIREDWARLHDLITRMDQQVGEKLRELDEAGVSDNTIVFFYSDHGGMISRSKRYIHNVGTQVPLIVKFPEKWQHLAPPNRGNQRPHGQLRGFPQDRALARRRGSLTSCKAASSSANTGTGNPRPCISSATAWASGPTSAAPSPMAATTSSAISCRIARPAATAATATPCRPTGTPGRNTSIRGKCNPVQSQFYQPKPVIELFDTAADPWHITNLAADPAHQERIAEALSRDLDQWMIETRDTGLIPEPLVPDLAGPGKPHETLYEYAQSDQCPIAELLEIAKQAALGDREKTSQYLGYTRHAHPVARYHGAYALFLTRSDDAAVRDALRKMIADDPCRPTASWPRRRSDAAAIPTPPIATLRKEIDATRNGYVFFHALNALQYAHLDDRLTIEDWKSFEAKQLPANPDHFGAEMAQRIITDAIELLPERHANRVIELAVHVRNLAKPGFHRRGVGGEQGTRRGRL